MGIDTPEGQWVGESLTVCSPGSWFCSSHRGHRNSPLRGGASVGAITSLSPPHSEPARNAGKHVFLTKKCGADYFLGLQRSNSRCPALLSPVYLKDDILTGRRGGLGSHVWSQRPETGQALARSRLFSGPRGATLGPLLSTEKMAKTQRGTAVTRSCRGQNRN